MFTIDFEGNSIPCLPDSNLRMALIHAKQPLYRNVARALNCRGKGACGTCAVFVEGPVSDLTEAERKRLKLEPSATQSELRLACQCSVQGDVRVRKAGGGLGLRIG